MEYSIEWVDDASNAVPEERATVADLRLFVGGQNVTKHLLNDTYCDHVTVALHGLAEGLVHDWWTILGSREEAVSLRRYRSGTLLPDVRIQCDGAVFEVSAHQAAYVDPDLRFWGAGSEIMSKEEGERRLTRLIEDVLSRIASKGFDGGGLADRWKRVQASRVSPERVFCEAAGALGLDPYRIAEHTADFIETAEKYFDGEPLIEFVAGAREGEPAKLVDWVDRMMRDQSSRYRLRALREVAKAAAKPGPVDEKAWSAGYRNARSMRRAMDLDQTVRLASFRDLARRLGAARSYDLAPGVDGISAMRREGHHDVHVHLRDHGRQATASATHLFVLARSVGDVVVFPGTQAAPINDMTNAYRQAAGRAFAAEFLAPIDEIRSMRADGKDGFSIAESLHVTPAVVRHQIENAERIDLACA